MQGLGSLVGLNSPMTNITAKRRINGSILLAMLADACRISLALFKSLCVFVATVLLCVLIYGPQGALFVCALTNGCTETLECSRASEKFIISAKNVLGVVVANEEYNLKEIVDPRIVGRNDVVRGVTHIHNELMVTVAGKSVRIPVDSRPIEVQRRALANFLEDPKSLDYQVEEPRSALDPSLRQMGIEMGEKLLSSYRVVSNFVQQRTKECLYSIGLGEPAQRLMQLLQTKYPGLANRDVRGFFTIWLLWIFCVCGFFGLSTVGAKLFEKVSAWTRQHR